MENTTSSCPKLCRNAHSELESYHPDPKLSYKDTSCNLQRFINWENINGKRAYSAMYPRLNYFLLHLAWTDVVLFTLVHSFQTQLSYEFHK
uniref:Uncharacterized protein n=1 Tax=Gopherus evgoodei TaxID=1825980 RepID=A0A8C4XZD5_9SAUR